MATAADIAATIEARLTAAGLDAGTLVAKAAATITPERAADSAGERAIEVLGALQVDDPLAGRLELHGTLGEGGMGVVRLGTQRALARPVAVKTLKPHVKTEAATLKLLREAWVTGSLEHPNVVPIYDVALEPDGSPLVVLKKIEGIGWDELMHDADAVKERFGVDDLLDWNLRTLMQVINAVHFAHSRGVLHRDLKPENVMVGEFGEVYLVDWGIAVSLRDDASGRLPLARDATALAGTLLYMAPEMLGGAGTRLGVRTDVYLLGSILYELVCGHPPHQGSALMELVAQVIESNPELPDDAPAELRDLIRAAMAVDPDDRVESAEAFRQCVQGFLEHRDATTLAARAEERLRALEAALDGLTEHDMPEAREPVYNLFGECRFGFQHALEVWPESERARAGLQRAVESVVRFELDHGEPEAAHALLPEAPEVPTWLDAEVQEARTKRHDEDAELRAMRTEHDSSVGRRARAYSALVLGTVWCVSALVPEIVVHLGVPFAFAHEVSIGFYLLFLGVITALAYFTRTTMTRTRVNRLVGNGAVLAMVLSLLVHITELVVGTVDFWVALRFQFPVWAAVVAMLALAVDRRMLIPAAGFCLGFVVLGLRPMWGFYAMAVCSELLLWTLVWAWLRREDLTAVHDHVRERGSWLVERAQREQPRDSNDTT